MTTPGIFKKILAIQSEIEVQRSGYDEKHGYSYFTASDTLEAVRDQMSKHGIIVRSNVKDWTHDSFYDNNGRYRPHVASVIEFIFTDSEDGSEYKTEVFAEGSDVGSDKSSRKAFTQAQKVAFLSVFLISENNDQFDSDGKPEAEPVNVKPVQEKIETAASVADLTAQIGELVKSGTIEASTVNKVGQRISDKVLGEGVAATSWRKDARVLQELANALKNGEVE